MSMVSCSNSSISDDLPLCCEEDSTILFGGEILPLYLSEINPMEYCEESIDELIENEVKYLPGLDYIARFRSQSLDTLAREESVLWILKVQRFYNFQPLTAYLAVNYMDRFLYSCRLTKTNGWPLQLLSVTCVSLAAKMEEALVPTLLDLQVGSSEFVFEPKTIQRMELLVLNVLDWSFSLLELLKLSYAASKVAIVCGGSYRRGKASCGDMDIVITHPDGQSHKGFLSRYLKHLKEMKFLREDLVFSTHSEEGTDSGVDTYFGLCTYPGRELRHRIDLKVYPKDIHAFGLIAWTGNDVLNRRLRILADSKGYRLDDTGLFLATQGSGQKRGTKASKSLSLKTEKEVFDFLGFPCLEPHERNL